MLLVRCYQTTSTCIILKTFKQRFSLPFLVPPVPSTILFSILETYQTAVKYWCYRDIKHQSTKQFIVPLTLGLLQWVCIVGVQYFRWSSYLLFPIFYLNYCRIIRQDVRSKCLDLLQITYEYKFRSKSPDSSKLPIIIFDYIRHFSAVLGSSLV